MPTEADPIVDHWYEHVHKGQNFQVVAYDLSAGLVEIQYFDGNIEELDLEVWYSLDVEPIAEPENWSGPVDVDNTDDYGTEVTDTNPEDWSGPLQEVKNREPGTPNWVSEENQDDWGEGYAREETWDGEL